MRRKCHDRSSILKVNQFASLGSTRHVNGTSVSLGSYVRMKGNGSSAVSFHSEFFTLGFAT